MASNQDAAELDSPRELELRLTLIPLGDTNHRRDDLALHAVSPARGLER